MLLLASCGGALLAPASGFASIAAPVNAAPHAGGSTVGSTTSPFTVHQSGPRVYDPTSNVSHLRKSPLVRVFATEEVAGGGAEVAFGPAPENAWNTFDQVEANGSPLAGFKGGGSFANDGRAGSQILPSDGAPYSEWDVNPNVQGVDRGGERIVTGSNGTAYYTSNHYQSFTQFWGPGQ
jgi:guanyl-specific ribonuclease Sa